jgi:hypothetical protein
MASFNERVVTVTNDAMWDQLVEVIVGEYDAKMLKAYRELQARADEAEARRLNVRGTRKLSVFDRRTRGSKYWERRRNEFYAEYEQQHPREPESESVLYDRILKGWR